MIYVASSWRNLHQIEVVRSLRLAGLDVYDYRHPDTDKKGFGWSEIDPNWKDWSTDQFLNGLCHPIAREGFRLDMEALYSCTSCVLVLPCGRSAHLELGCCIGFRKPTAIYWQEGGEPTEPELMYLMASTRIVGIDRLIHWARAKEQPA